MDFEVDDSRARIDRDVAWEFLSTQAYWGQWRKREDLDRQIDVAWRVVGAYRKPDGRLIGFARAFSDGVGTAYLADVFVAPEARGHGIGKALIQSMIEDGPGSDFRWMLHTDDAHDLYRAYGFVEPDHTYLERPSRLS
ncbi:GNAT family N-acetyltransferase [Saccharopolyspora spinosa]|uniref:Acetyltransferase (GNAT) family protein n=1 Tax=Saccharopolyspora spinosa TaxID=60894 RepID=A0A2N3XUS0_SACSN|nr:GNAT family N-acetyltransferase [Saccharopolyspora spinosa]PKW14426.1 acetyltransferase (GNAT) family protein [Saccharopolyspora spinosa]